METTRQSYLDWLRMFAILGVLFFHSAMPFAAEESWHIRNKDESYLLTEFNFWLSRFRMPLLFFISGAVCHFILKKKTAGQFIALRFKRLFIPLVIGMLIIVPPQVYMERLVEGKYSSFLEFYPSIFSTGPYPQGNLSWHHLWFIAYLFIYDVLCAPLFVWLMSEKGKSFMQKLNFLSKGHWIYLLALPSIMQWTFMILQFNRTNDLLHDYTMLPYWLSFVFVGFLIVSHDALLQSLVRNRRSSLMVAFVATVIVNYLRWNSLEPWDAKLPGWESNPFTYLFLALFPTLAWSWVFALVGYGKKYLNSYHKIHDYCNPAVYPFYILHQTVIVILAYYVVQVSESILAKYLFLVTFSFVTSMLIYHTLIRPYSIMRFLFGMKAVKENMQTVTDTVKATPSPVTT